jgi:hypothetical protein
VVDLFGEEVMPPQEAPRKKRREPIPKGYAGIPGTGPQGKTCKDCAHYYLQKMANTYRKCYLTRKNWTGGRGSDIKASAPACSYFAPEEKK